MSRLFAFDTEDNSAGEIYHINFYDGESHYSFTDRDAAISFLSATPGKYWATNLEYDLCNIFGDKLDIVEWHFGKSKLIWARFGACYFFDTLNHWKYSVAEMGERLGRPKLPFDPQNLTYCKRDTEITFDFMKLMSEVYMRMGAKVRSTIASTALSHWETLGSFPLKTRFENGEKISIIPPKILERFKCAYYGGRTEAFHIGEVRGDVQYLDINSMYPYCMTKPLFNPYHYVPRSNRRFPGITYAEVKSDMAVPVLPYRDDRGILLFPNGRFSGCWTNDELNYFEQRGGKVLKTSGGYYFNLVVDPFSEWIRLLYEKRRTSKDEFVRLALKGLMNNLYGKFAQGNERTLIMTREKYVASKYRAPSRLFGNLVIFNNVGDYPYQTNFVWSAYITSRARILLHSLMLEVIKRGGKLLYCDTDSVIFQGALDGLPVGDQLGQFKHEGTFKSFNCRTSKVYKYEKIDGTTVYKCKGVPSKDQKNFFENSQASFEKPLRLREALRRDMRPNIWISSSKVFIENYSKGIIGRDGDIEPLRIGGRK